MKNKKIINFLIVAVFIVGAVFLLSGADTQEFDINKIKYVALAETKLNVELADTEEEKTKGLSGRSELGENDSMLFVFDIPGRYPFWMKDMNFPIDIIWLAPSLGGDGGEVKIVYIKKNATPESYPESFSPDQNAKYVLETVSGFSDKYNLKVGDRVQFSQ